MRRNVQIFPIGSMPLGDDFSFYGMMLSEELHCAVESGVSNAIAATVVYDDDGSSDVDPMSDIRVNKMDKLESNITTQGGQLLSKIRSDFEKAAEVANASQQTAAQSSEGGA